MSQVSIALFLVLGATYFTDTSSYSVKRQANLPIGSPPPGFPAEELLPPPALSASFPTLRPRRPQPQNTFPNQSQNRNVGLQEPPRDLIPPLIRPPAPQGQPARRPSPQNAAPSTTTTPLPLLPPLEIPPERPLTDNEIQATLIKESSFIPTTGQGLPTPNAKISVPSGNKKQNSNALVPIPVIVPSIQETPTTNSGNSSSTIRFPSDSGTLALAVQTSIPRNCPSCECTNEVDYICGSNGVLYLNSCSFDCATFCDIGK